MTLRLGVPAPLRRALALRAVHPCAHSHLRRSRRGAEAVEFALVFPVFMMLLAGAFDYGLLFFTQFQVNAELHQSLRWGSLQQPTDLERELGGCDECVDAAQRDALAVLADLDIDMVERDVQPVLEQLDGTCALVLEVDVPHEPLVGLFYVPTKYTLKSALPTQQVTRC